MGAHLKVLKIFMLALAVIFAFWIVPALVDSGQKASAEGPYTLIYYDGHMHTIRSDGSGDVADIKATAQARGLSAVIVTDHCNMLSLDEWNSLVAATAAASDSSFLALAGVEITGSEGLLNRGHMNALRISDPFVGDDADELCPEEVWPDPPNPAGTGANAASLTAWADYVHSQGGIAVHNHTSGSTALGYGVDAIELYNQSHVDDVAFYATVLGYPPDDALQFGLLLNNLAIYGERDLGTLVPFPGFPDPIPVRLAVYYATLGFTGVGQWLGSPEAPLNSWDDLLMAYVNGTIDEPIFGVANSDAHNTGAPDSNVGIAKTGLYVLDLTPAQLYHAIESGRAFATTGPSLDFHVNGEMMGGTAAIASGESATVDMSVDSESPSAVLVKIDIIKNGNLLQTVSPMSAHYEGTVADTVSEDGYYRVEVTSYDPAGSYHFAYSNPVFVRTGPVGGIVELAVGDDAPAAASASSSGGDYVLPLAAALAGFAVALTAGACYTRRRWLR